MSNKDEGYSSSSFWQLIIAIPGTILAATILISLLAHFSNNTETAPAAEQPVAAKSDENIKPVATVEVAKADAGPHADKSGEEVFKAVCTACHTPGLMNAPKFGDKGQWEARIAQGYDTLIKNATNGIRGMPARGGNPDLTDGEIANAVAHMANAAGANFTPPAPAKPAEAAPDTGAAPAPAPAS
jgi:cytochrome c5